MIFGVLLILPEKSMDIYRKSSFERYKGCSKMFESKVLAVEFVEMGAHGHGDSTFHGVFL